MFRTLFSSASQIETKDRKRLFVFDLDGVVVDCSARLRNHVDYAARDRGDTLAYEQSFLRYNQTVNGDVAIPMGLRLIYDLSEAREWDRIIALTARDEIGREPTLAWLRTHLWLPAWYTRRYGLEFRSEDLLMRPTCPLTSDGEIIPHLHQTLNQVQYKAGRMDELESQGYTIELAVDDHPHICDMYQRRGIPTLRAQWPSVDCLSPSGEPFRSETTP